MPIKVTRYAELKPKWGISFSNVHLLRLEKAGLFPRRVRLGDSVYWVDSEIDAYLRQRIAERSAPVSSRAKRNREETMAVRTGPNFADALVAILRKHGPCDRARLPQLFGEEYPSRVAPKNWGVVLSVAARNRRVRMNDNGDYEVVE